MRMKHMCLVLAAFSASLVGECLAEAPEKITELADEMSSSGAEVRAGHSKEFGVYIVAVARAAPREDTAAARDRAAEKAAVKAKNSVASFIETSVASSTESRTDELVVDGAAQVREFFSSATRTTCKQLLKGIQTLRTRSLPGGEVETVVFVMTSAGDASGKLREAMLSAGDRGTVVAVGISSVRAEAEKNALRSAVEQVAGTIVVGKTSVIQANEKEEFHRRLSTSAGALVEEYRVTKETKIETEYRLEIVAKVSKRKIYESYKSFFKALDNPVFAIESTNMALTRGFTQYFVDKGMRITENAAEANYIIRLDGTFTERKSPISGNDGTMLRLAIEIVSADGSTVLLKMTERKAKDSNVLSKSEREAEVSRMIFEKVRGRLDEAIHKMVVKMLDDAD